MTPRVLNAPNPTTAGNDGLRRLISRKAVNTSPDLTVRRWGRQARSHGLSLLGVLLSCAAASAQPEAQTPPLSEIPPFRVEAPKPLVPLHVNYPTSGTGETFVVVEVDLTPFGTVERVRPLTGEEPFVAVALEAAKSWVFTPAYRIDTQTGSKTPLAARIRIELRFRPESNEYVAPLSSPTAAQEPTPIEASTSIPEVEVIVEGQQASAAPRRLSRNDVRMLPGAFGDPFRAIEILPGVTPVASGLPFFYVRGAPPGNGGYFFADTALPALFHVGAGPGVIHPAFIESVSLYSGVAPVRFGRFAGAIVAAEPKLPEGLRRTELTLRLVDVGGFTEQPFASDRGNIMLAGRYSYTGLLVPLIVPGVELGYWDYQARASYRFGRSDTITIFAFGAHDFLAADDDIGVRRQLYDVTFHRINLGLAKQLAPDSAWQTRLGFVWDRTSAGNPAGNASGNLGKYGLNIVSEVSHTLSSEAQLRCGVNIVLERIDASLDVIGGGGNDRNTIDRDDDGENLEILPVAGVPDTLEDLLLEARRARRQATLSGVLSPRNDSLAAVWIDMPLRPTQRVSVTPGVRFDYYKTGSADALAFEPRIDTRLRIVQGLNALHAIGLSHQPPSFGAPVPGLTASVAQGLQQAWHTHAGLEWNLNSSFDASLTAFQSALFAGSDALGILNLQRSDLAVDAAVDRVTGHAYGLEVYARGAVTPKLGGFLSYTLSRATRSIGRLYGPATFDRRHVLNLALSYDFGSGFHAGARGVFYTGGPAEVAYPQAAIDPPRTPPYLRLDWRVEKRWAVGSRGESLTLVAETLNTTLAKESLNVSCYAYGCTNREVGPVTVPSLGLEARL
jgi:hypothetical protein